VSDRCFECDFDYSGVEPASAPAQLREYAERYRDALISDGIRTRPSVWTWSALEYTCHMRDVFAVYRQRAELVQAGDIPELRSMERDSRVIKDRYNEQDRAVVVDELERNGRDLAVYLENLDADGWSRVGMHPVTGEQSVQWMAANCIHEARHHLMDVKRVLALVSG
jgi:hypothetical protein